MRGKQQESGHWTDPYLDNDGGKTMLFTYSLPVHDGEGRVVGVIGADISLEWLQSQLMEIDLKNNNLHTQPRAGSASGDLCYSFIIGRSGSSIVQPSWQRAAPGDSLDPGLTRRDALRFVRSYSGRPLRAEFQENA